MLDALDECQESSRRAIITKLVEVHKKLDPNDTSKPILKFLVTSRPYSDIERNFKELTDTLPQIRLAGEDEYESISQEIDLVIRNKCKGLESKLDLDESTKLALEEKLLETPERNRTYLWLHLTFDELEHLEEPTENQVIATISTLPSSVDEAYTAILNKSRQKERANMLLHIVLAALRPLTLREVNIAMALERDCHLHKDLNLWPTDKCKSIVKNICGLFLQVVDSKIYLIHQTAREFLVCNTAAPVMCQGQWKQSFTPVESNLVLAKICISYLQLDFKYSTSVTRESLIDNRSLMKPLPENIKRCIKTYDFLGYAAENWPVHFNKAKVTNGLELVKTVADKLCSIKSRNFLLWFPTYSRAIDRYILILPVGVL